MSGIVDALKNRRSIYAIGKDIPLSDEELTGMLGDIIKNMPTAFNMQSTRMVLLLGEDHDYLWNTLVLDTLRVVTPEENFPRTQSKIASFAAGHGTVLYFDDTSTTHRFAEENPLYKNLFEEWSVQQNGMLQFAVWTALEEHNIGASLQHYNPLIDDKVRYHWQLPEDWRLFAQMPFGKILAPADDKDFLPLDLRFKVFG